MFPLSSSFLLTQAKRMLHMTEQEFGFALQEKIMWVTPDMSKRERKEKIKKWPD